ncbi:hypothetical protein C7293_02615 [filamentous cyanobacterium CCT1]|nr:hypothetical protein C7293_02615 [filamentous cyanobacterium CCT1]PSN81611.1 hypothetical protein C8B47_00405 [filamentous cyanobacterium CCP4]
MNVLIVSDFQVYPPNSGAGIAQFGVLEPLSKQCNISVLFNQYFTPSDKELDELRQLLPNIKFYTLKDSVKKTRSKKLFDILKKLKLFDILKKLKNTLKNLPVHSKNFIKSIFIGSNLESGKDFDANLFNFYTFLCPPNSKQKINKILEIINSDSIEIIQLDFESNLNIVSLIPDGIKKVYGCYDCQFYRVETYIKAKLTQTEYANYIRDYIKTIEVSFLQQYDVVIANTEAEASVLDKALNAQCKRPEVVLAPYPVLDQDFIELDRSKFSRPDKLLFVGIEYHLPNKDGIEWFLEEAAIEIFKKFGLRLYVVGTWDKGTKQRYIEHPSQVIFTGFVDDLSSLIQSSIYISPMRLGSGLRAKTLTAMAQGMPVIAHPQGLMGNSAKHMESVMIADDTASFCFAVEYLLTDLDRTFTLCKNAQELMRAGYSQSFVAEKRFHIYEKLLK